MNDFAKIRKLIVGTKTRFYTVVSEVSFFLGNPGFCKIQHLSFLR